MHPFHVLRCFYYYFLKSFLVSPPGLNVSQHSRMLKGNYATNMQIFDCDLKMNSSMID